MKATVCALFLFLIEYLFLPHTTTILVALSYGAKKEQLFPLFSTELFLMRETNIMNKTMYNLCEQGTANRKKNLAAKVSIKFCFQ